ncbi:MAG: hypothetical protein DRP00_04360 [Candidatus Aenigmatarchaeota archaeon]|nr:MAG: hypothetical protein DRP00_04360 [Candidatus Aenigmarchaeota archaeon]
MNKIPICPNCKHTDFKVQWVKRYRNVENISFREYARKIYEKRINTSTYEGTIEIGLPGTLWSSTYYVTDNTTVVGTVGSSKFLTTVESTVEDLLKDFIQLVMICKNCGYTVVINIDEWRLANEL